MLRRKMIVLVTALAALGLSDLVLTNAAEAGMFDMMNPSRWFSDRDRGYYGRDYYDRGYYGRGYGPYGYGGGPYGWGGYPGYGGWGGGPYGWGGYPGYGGWGGYPYGGVPVTGATKEAAPKLPE